MIVQYSGIFTTEMCNGIVFGRSVARYDNIRNAYKHNIIYANIIHVYSAYTEYS